MGKLKDTIINGLLRVNGGIFGDLIQARVVNAPTTAGGTTYGPGTNGQVLKSNGSSAYWAADTNTDTNVTQTATTTSANYEVLFSATADNTTRTEGARKSNKLLFNPSNGKLTMNNFVVQPMFLSQSVSVSPTSFSQSGDNYIANVTVSQLNTFTDSTDLIFVVPDDTSYDIYTAAQIRCTSFAFGTMSLLAKSLPTDGVYINVACFKYLP